MPRNCISGNRAKRSAHGAFFCGRCAGRCWRLAKRLGPCAEIPGHRQPRMRNNGERVDHRSGPPPARNTCRKSPSSVTSIGGRRRCNATMSISVRRHHQPLPTLNVQVGGSVRAASCSFGGGWLVQHLRRLRFAPWLSNMTGCGVNHSAWSRPRRVLRCRRGCDVLRGAAIAVFGKSATSGRASAGGRPTPPRHGKWECADPTNSRKKVT